MLDPTLEAHFERYVSLCKKQRLEFRNRLDVLPCSVRIDDIQSNVARARKGFLTGTEFSALWRKRRASFARWLRATYDATIIDSPPSLTRYVQETLGITTPVLGTLWTLFRTQVEKHRVIVGPRSSSLCSGPIPPHGRSWHTSFR
jgi:hypothetical protein